jgi:lipopolysaccharide transport system permease protein
LISLLAFGYFLAVGLSPRGVRFRDLPQAVASVMQIGFFVTPVIWQRGQGRLSSDFVDLNPLYHLMEIIRAPLLGQWPTLLNWSSAGGAAAAAALFAFISLGVTRRQIYLWL